MTQDESRATLEAKLEAAERQLRENADAAREMMFWFYIAESHVEELARGIVSPFMRAQFLYGLDTEGELQRNAAKAPGSRKRRA